MGYWYGECYIDADTLAGQKAQEEEYRKRIESERVVFEPIDYEWLDQQKKRREREASIVVKPIKGSWGYRDYLWRTSVVDLTPEERKDREYLVEAWKLKKQKKQLKVYKKYEQLIQSVVEFPVTDLVYFVLDPYMDLVKIGFTGNLKQRFRALQLQWGESIQLLGMMDGSMKTERALHKMFSPFQCKMTTHKEWFFAEKPLLFFVDHLCEIK